MYAVLALGVLMLDTAGKHLSDYALQGYEVISVVTTGNVVVWTLKKDQ